MNPNGGLKVCPLCAETIKAAAKLCPHCQTRQSRFAAWLSPLLCSLIALMYLALFLVVWGWLFPDESDDGDPLFARHRNELSVVRTLLERTQKKPEFWLSGYVTNKGTHPWRVRELEVRFQDAQGHMLDVHHPNVSASFVVQPQREHAFRVELGKPAITNAGVVTRVRVQMATDGNLPAKPE